MHTTTRLFLLIVAVLALSLLASPLPDGLERSAEQLAFHTRAQENTYGILTDYALPGLNELPSTLGAGLLGVIVVSISLYVLGRVLTNRRPDKSLSNPESPDKHALQK